MKLRNLPAVLCSVLWTITATACLEEPAQFPISLRFLADGDVSQIACGDPTPPTGPVPVFLGTGQVVRTLVVDVPCDTTTGETLTLTTSLGQLSPAANDAAGQASATRYTLGDRDVTFSLFVGSTPGNGIVTVDSGDGASAAAEFRVVDIQQEPTIDGPDTELVADGYNEYVFVVTVDTLSTELAAVADVSSLSAEPVSVELEVTRGELSPHLAPPASSKRTIQVLPNDDSGTEVTFFAGRTPGPAEMIARVQGGTETTFSFQLQRPEEVLAIGLTGPIVADGQSAHVVDLTLTSDTEEPQQLELESTLAPLNPSAAPGVDRFKRTVLISPSSESSILLYASATPGEGTLTATLASGERTQASFTVAAPTDSLTVDLPAEVDYFADAEQLIPIEVSLESNARTDREVTVVSSTGILNPAGADDASMRRRVFTLADGESRVLSLRASRESGTALVTATVANSSTVDEAFELLYSPPTDLTLTLSPSVFQTGLTQLDADAFFRRPQGQGRVSLGTEVRFLSCCDADGDGTTSECTEFIDTAAFGVASATGEDQVGFAPTLTPTGLAFVQATGTPPADDLAVTFHAYVIDPEDDPVSVDCAAVDALGEFPSGVLASDSAVAALRHSEP